MKIYNWLAELLEIIREFAQACLAYMLGRERCKRQQAEANLKLQEAYAKLDAKNKSYRDRGKLGLLERLRKARDAAPK